MSKIIKKLENVEIGKTFEVGGVEFIKFNDINGQTAVVAKDIVFSSKYGRNNNFAESNILSKLTKNFLPKIVDAVGDHNICEVETDLTSLDGLKIYGKLKSKVSLPTFDFYRTNVKIFDEYNPDTWWWLATPDSESPHQENWPWIVCVAPSGGISIFNYLHDRGVRPFLIFVSTISVSCEE